MDIQNKPTLEEKQAFWAEQLPNFEAKYWLPSHFELLEFDMEGGNYEVRDVLPEHYSEDDATEIWHRVNTGWAMWKKAINFIKVQAVLEPVLDAPACVGAGTFQKGVKCSTVISAAQRHYKNDGHHERPVVSVADQLRIASGHSVVVPKERLAKAVDGIEELFKEDSTLALGELLPIQQDLNAMIEAQEQSHD